MVTKESQTTSTHAPLTPRAPPTPQAMQPILRLQRAAGNLAVGQLLQAKLEIGSPNDPAEREADDVASAVMDNSSKKPCTCGTAGAGDCEKCRQAGLQVARAPVAGSATTGVAPPILHSVLARGGQPLEGNTRSFMEGRFGHDFGDVRIHADSQAADSARAIGARAYTVGRDVAFGAGQYSPETGEGQRLLAHELTHVLQQQTASNLGSPLRRKPNPGPVADIHSQIAAISRSPDPMEVIRVMDLPDFSRATEPERLTLIRVVNQFGGGDPARLARLWSSFGEGRTPEVVATHMHEWEESTKLWPGMPDLVPAVTKVVSAFRVALKVLAEFNLAQNERYVQARMEQMGFVDGATKPMSAGEMTNYRQNVQKIAYQVWTLRMEQDKARRIPIGRSVGRISLPVTFDPAGPHAHEGPVDVDVPLWTKIKSEWDESQTLIADASSKYPEIYEAVAQGDNNALLAFSRVMSEDPANPSGSSLNAAQGKGFQTKLKELLNSLAERIKKARSSVASLDFLELKPLHEHIFAAPGRWKGGFDQWVAKRAVERHARDEATLKVLADMAEGAVALVAIFATGGMALALGAVGVGIGVARAGVDLVEAGRLNTAAKATPLRGTELVAQAQADAKTIQARTELFAAIIGAFLIGGAKGIEFLEGRLTRLLERLVADEALRASLLAKIPDKAKLIELLGKADSPSELSTLLATHDTAMAEFFLDLRATTRARAAALRAQHQPRLDANPAIEKELQEAESALKDPVNAEAAEKQIDGIARKLADLDFQEGVMTPVTGVVVEENKFNYLFGKAAPDAHNTPRSDQNQGMLSRIGLVDNEESRAAIRAHLERVPEDPSNVISTSPGREIPPGKFPKNSVFEGHWGGPTETRESLLSGPGGQVRIESTWEVRYGTRRLTTVIPKGQPLKGLR